MIVLGLLKSGKVRLRRTIDRGNLRKLLGMQCNKFVLHHGDALLDGNAHSVRYGEIIHDGSGQPDSAKLPRRGRFPKLSSWAVTQQNLSIKF